MSIHSDTLCIIIAWCQEAIPVAQWLESIVDQHDRVALLSGAIGITDVAIRISPVLFSYWENTTVKACGPE